MRYSARQQPETLQLLRLEKVLAEALALRHVAAEDGQPTSGGVSVNLKPGVEGRVIHFKMHGRVVLHRTVQFAVNCGVLGARTQVPYLVPEQFLTRYPA